MTNKDLSFEIRFRVLNVSIMTKRLMDADYTCLVPQGKEHSEFYDQRGGFLVHNSGGYVRLTERKERSTMSTKSNLDNAQQTSTQTEISDASAMRDILYAAGLRRIGFFAISRSVWERGNTLAVLDRTSVGTFLEIQGSSVNVINRAARQLGIDLKKTFDESYYNALKVEC